MNVEKVAERHSETLEDISEWFEGLYFGRFRWRKRPKSWRPGRHFNRHGRPVRRAPVTLSWSAKMETVQ